MAMAAASMAMATAAGVAVVLYFLVSRRVSSSASEKAADMDGDELARAGRAGRRRILRRPAQAPATWLETLATLSEIIRFTYSETLGKWPIGDLAFGINYLLRRQGNLHADSVYAGENCVQLIGPEILADMVRFLKLLNHCMLFSKKPFPVFLESAGYTQDDVFLQEPKAGILKPAFTILRDHNSKCFFLLIRGTHSKKDTLTAATGAVVPFHHLLLHEGGVSNLILGYAHCGMVAAARWIMKLTIPCLLKAVNEHPDYKVKVVGHSLGGGTAAILTYILRERKEFCSTTCVAFAPAACMTWDLAESGKDFITSVINGSDLVPTLSTSSVDELRSEVKASSWLDDLRDQVEHTRVLNVVYRSASALGSHMPSIASARARVMSAGSVFRPLSAGTQGLMKRAQDVAEAVVRARPSTSSWSCMSARRRTVNPAVNIDGGECGVSDACLISEENRSFVTVEAVANLLETSKINYSNDGGGEADTPVDHVVGLSSVEDMSEGELWYELEKELHRQDDELEAQVREEAQAAREITEEENVVIANAIEDENITTTNTNDRHKFYPPGKILHMVALPRNEYDSDENDATTENVGIYQTPRELYSKIHLSQTMIQDHYMPMYKKRMELLISELLKNINTCE